MPSQSEGRNSVSYKTEYSPTFLITQDTPRRRKGSHGKTLTPPGSTRFQVYFPHLAEMSENWPDTVRESVRFARLAHTHTRVRLFLNLLVGG